MLGFIGLPLRFAKRSAVDSERVRARCAFNSSTSLSRISDLESDAGALKTFSTARRSLIRHAAWLEAIVDSYELQLASGQALDVGADTQALNSLLGLYRLLGLERRWKALRSRASERRGVSMSIGGALHLNALARLGNLGEPGTRIVAKDEATESAETDHAGECQANGAPRAARAVFADVGVHGDEPYTPPAPLAGVKGHT